MTSNADLDCITTVSINLDPDVAGAVGDIESIIDEMYGVLLGYGYRREWPFSDDNNPLLDIKRAKGPHSYAGLAILHAVTCRQAVADGQTQKAVFNALVTQHYRYMAIMGQGGQRISATMAPAPAGSDAAYQARADMVQELRLQGVQDAFMARRLAAVDGGYATPGLVPKQKVDRMRRYLLKFGLIQK
jgi:hypothetical protein